MEKRIESLEALSREGEAFSHGLRPETGRALLVTLSGELGAGKTAFTKEVAKAFGVEETVNSPTFVLEKKYELSNSAFKRLIHIDAYRLEGGAELKPLGFDELMNDPGNLVMLEWPEKVADALPSAAVSITLRALDDGAHTIAYA